MRPAVVCRDVAIGRESLRQQGLFFMRLLKKVPYGGPAHRKLLARLWSCYAPRRVSARSFANALHSASPDPHIVLMITEAPLI
jgi:hypothetical protein